MLAGVRDKSCVSVDGHEYVETHEIDERSEHALLGCGRKLVGSVRQQTRRSGQSGNVERTLDVPVGSN